MKEKNSIHCKIKMLNESKVAKKFKTYADKLL